ncbi:MAG TPA: response regulator transcription factor [Oculatellaceae cyanobacterium]
MKILLVEDDDVLSRGLRMALQESGYAVEVSNDGAEADLLLATVSYDLIVLDLNLPSLDGLEILKRFRKAGKSTPILILSARDALQTRVMGLDLGANDYLTKPFELSELAARVRALLRKDNWGNLTEIVQGNLRFDTTDRSVFVDEKKVELSLREVIILEMLLKRAGRVVNKDQLLDELASHELELTSNALEIVVHRLRKKLEHFASPIRTLRGLGYVLEKPTASLN